MNNNNSTEPKLPVQPTNKKPNEQVGFHFSSSLKITDPETGRVILQKRAD